MDLVDVSGADGNQDIPRLKSIVQSCRDLVKGLYKPGRLPIPDQSIGEFPRDLDGLRGDAFPRREGRSDQNFVGRTERLGEIRHERHRAGNLVWLKYAPDPSAAKLLANGFQRRADGGRMMGVVVQQRDASPGSHQFQPATDSAEFFQSLADLPRGQADGFAERHRGQRIPDVVSPADLQADFCEEGVFAIGAKPDSGRRPTEVASPPVGLTFRSNRDAAGLSPIGGGDRRFTVCADNQHAVAWGDTFGEFAKCVGDGSQIGEAVEVIGFDVQDRGVAGGIVEEAPLKLAALDHQQISGARPAAPAAVAEFRPENDGGGASGVRQQQSGHGGRRAFTVRPRDADACAVLHQTA